MKNDEIMLSVTKEDILNLILAISNTTTIYDISDTTYIEYKELQKKLTSKLMEEF